MEESGHYYTVYYTSLAVGFDEEIAFRQAVLSQMADEVAYLDAAHMHINNVMDVVSFGHFGRECDLEGIYRNASAQWRFKIEYALHALVNKSILKASPSYLHTSEFQRRTTLDLLKRYTADSVEFGLLLHRLGDTYAHTVFGRDDIMYQTTRASTGVSIFWDPRNMGHFLHGHVPDYWFLRPDLFYVYLMTLYNTLLSKLKETKPAAKQRLSLEKLQFSYRTMILQHSYKLGLPDFPFEKVRISFLRVDTTGSRLAEMRKLLIEDIRNRIKSLPDITDLTIKTFASYVPEKGEELRKFSEFLSSPGINKLSARNVLNAKDVVNAIENITKGLDEADIRYYQQTHP